MTTWTRACTNSVAEVARLQMMRLNSCEFSYGESGRIACWLRFVGATMAVFAMATAGVAVELQVATFKVDATPPVGSPLCDGLVPPVTGVNDPLWARGVVLKAEDQPAVVLVALDWVGIGNEGHDEWREKVAEACGTTPDRVCVHALHQHDAPGCDFLAEKIAAEAGLVGQMFNVAFAHEAIDRTAKAAAEAMKAMQPATHVGHGLGRVERVACNRRIMGPNGKVKLVRWSRAIEPEIRDAPEGTIDPNVRLVSFWNGDKPLAVLSYYAVHPQSYYRTGKTSADFVGMARDFSEEGLAGALQIHFNGCGGNITAGKYNDGEPATRIELAKRLAAGMKAAWDSTRKESLADASFDWQVVPVVLPLAEWVNKDELAAVLRDESAVTVDRIQASRAIAFAQRCESQHEVPIARLRIGSVDLLHLPGETFIEYQLAAQALRPERFVCTAGYGDYGSGYIGLAKSYAEGGYETGRVSRVSPRVEGVLMHAIGELLK